MLARVEERHRSREFIGLLKEVDAYYPPHLMIRVILDNHSANISKETRACLACRPNPFRYIHTPKHGSWLNLVETLFGKMARTFLRQIRVTSTAELETHIFRGMADSNAPGGVSLEKVRSFHLLICKYFSKTPCQSEVEPQTPCSGKVSRGESSTYAARTATARGNGRRQQDEGQMGRNRRGGKEAGTRRKTEGRRMMAEGDPDD